ncbi:MAG: SPOR domain-containing protein [Gemmatimonadales bacterium]|nr:SPOR domain-containing protein [Gemmatimonadales bacterium]
MSKSQDRFGDLPLYLSTWDPTRLDFAPGRDFQTEIEELVLQGELESTLDEAMTGKSSPRIWMLLHEPGQGRFSAVAALYFARELASRGQGVMVLDCDDEDSTLTRWAGRMDCEGWADMVRYGASALTCGIPLPFTGRQGYLLGPGSYTPVDAQPEEVEQILARLRHQADDLLLVCPVGDTGRLWSRAAEIRILCWDRAATASDRIEGVVADFAKGSAPLTGLISFGSVPEKDAGKSEVLPGDKELPVDKPVDKPEEKQEEKQEDPQPQILTSFASEDGDLLDGAPGANKVFVDLFGKASAPGPNARKRGTSLVFWWVALGAVGLIVLSAWYYMEFVRVSQTDSTGGGDQPVAEITLGADSEPPTVIVPDTVSVQVSSTAPDTGSVVGRGSISEGLDSVEEDQEILSTGDSDSLQTFVREESGEESEVQAAQEFDMDPYLIPVGTDGWAIHLYSFPDEESAEDQLQILLRKGFMTEARSVQIKGKGRWHRIYLGSFPDRATAQQALDPLLEKLGADWGRPTEF